MLFRSPYHDSGEPAIGGIHGLQGIEWMPYDGYTDLTPGQHLRSMYSANSTTERVNFIDPRTQSCALETIRAWIGNNPVIVYHDSGSPLSFHTKSFRQRVSKWTRPEKIGARTLRARGYFGSPHAAPTTRLVDLYKFKVQLQHHGREYEIISHEMPDKIGRAHV